MTNCVVLFEIYIYFFIFLHISIKVLHNLLEITKCMQKISANANDIFVKHETKWIFHNLLNTHAHEQNISAKHEQKWLASLQTIRLQS